MIAESCFFFFVGVGSCFCWALCLRSHEAEIKLFVRVAISSGDWDLLLSPWAVGRIQFLMVTGQRFLLPCCWPRGDTSHTLDTVCLPCHMVFSLAWQYVPVRQAGESFLSSESLPSGETQGLLWGHLIRSGPPRMVSLLISSKSTDEQS